MKRTITILALVATLAGAATAQDGEKLPRWRIDPYTRNEPKLLERLGYVSYGPFEFGQRGATPIQTTAIDEHLSAAEILWVETAHYRIGSTLEAVTVPFEPAIKAKIRAELTRLAERGLPRVKPKTRRLDRWLRLHLFAQRLEEHYAEMQDWLGVDDSSFPSGPDERAEWTGAYMGEGAYLGQRGKYLFLLFEQTTNYNNYLESFVGRRTVSGQQWNFKTVDGLLYSCSADNPHEDGRLKDDTALHGHVIHAATHGLLNGYLHYNYDMPVWIREGLAHWFERRVGKRFNSFTRSEGAPPISQRKWRWEIETRRLIATEKFTPFAEAFTWRDFGEMDFEDHIAIWSRWDYLLSLGQEKFAAFLKAVKGQIDPTTGIMEDDIVGGSRTALFKVYKLTPLTLDERWMEWVSENYATR